MKKLAAFLSRRYRTSLTTILALTVFITSCKKENASLPLNNSDEAIRGNVIPDSIKALLYGAGFDTADVRKFKDGYVVENDILITQEHLQFFRQLPKGNSARHARSYNTVDAANNNITIGFTSALWNSAAGSKIYYAVRDAASKWNGLNTCSLNFIVLSGVNTNVDIVIDVFGDARYYALAGFPTGNGKAFNLIQVNTSFVRTDTQWLLILAHEIGHCIGLRHTDWDRPDPDFPWQTAEPSDPDGAIYIPNTPASDPNSIMNSNVGALGLPWTGFSQFDVVAANTLHPVVTGLSYQNRINGPAVVPNGPASLTHTCAALYPDYNYDWKLTDMNDNTIYEFDEHGPTLDWSGNPGYTQYKLQCKLTNLELPGVWQALVITAQ